MQENMMQFLTELATTLGTTLDKLLEVALLYGRATGVVSVVIFAPLAILIVVLSVKIFRWDMGRTVHAYDDVPKGIIAGGSTILGAILFFMALHDLLWGIIYMYAPELWLVAQGIDKLTSK